MEFSKQEYWKGLLFPTPRDFPDPEKESMSLASPTLADGFFTTAPPFNCDLSVSKNPFLFFYTYRSLNKPVPLPWLRTSGLWIHSASQNSTDHVAVRRAKSNHQWLQIAKVSFSFILHILCGSNGTSVPSSPHSKLRLKEKPLSGVLPLAVQREESSEGLTKAIKHSSLEVTPSLPLLPDWRYPVYSHSQPLGTRDQAMQS